MKVTIEDQSTVKKIMHIEVPHEDVVQELDNAYRELKKNAKVKGFRPGKTPRSVLERLYGKDVKADVSAKLIQESFVEALKETGLDIIGSPKVDPPQLDGQSPLRYDAAVEVKPPIDPIDYKGLTLKKTKREVGEADIEVQLKMLQKNMAQKRKIEENRPLAEGDYAVIDYEGYRKGKPFAETGRTENFTLKIGDGHIIKEFDEQLVGMQAGEEREIKIKFPEDYFNPKLASLDVDFKVTLKEIREEELPPIDDELVKGLGQFESLEQLKNVIKDNLQQGYAKRTEQELNEQIFQALIAKSEFELPDAMVDYELEGILKEAERSFSYSAKSMEELGLTRAKLAEKYRGTAEKQVRRQLILAQIVKQEGLTLTDEEWDEGFQMLADTFKQPKEDLKEYYQSNEEQLELFKHSLLEKKAIKLIIDTSALEEAEPGQETVVEASET
jgi:trigger factor